MGLVEEGSEGLPEVSFFLIEVSFFSLSIIMVVALSRLTGLSETRWTCEHFGFESIQL